MLSLVEVRARCVLGWSIGVFEEMEVENPPSALTRVSYS